MIEHDEAFVAEARSYLGTPWRHQGRNRMGIDCVGLVIVSARINGLKMDVAANYGLFHPYREVKRQMMQYMERASCSSVGTVLLYKKGMIIHMAIDTGEGTIIQSLADYRQVIETPLNFKPHQFWNMKWPS